MSNSDVGVPIEQFIQALTTQLDRAQTAMALKAENLDLPLTFAVKDLSLDLRTQVNVVKSEVRIRPAGPGDADASMLHLALTTITRPMIKENARSMTLEPDDEPTLKEAVGDGLTDDEQTRLGWAGVHTVAQLRKLAGSGAGKEVERVADLPVDRLRQALARASQPFVARVEPHLHGDSREPNADPLLSIRGRNLMMNGAPRVTIAGQPVSVLKASDREVLIAPMAHQFAGMLSIETGPDSRADVAFDLGFMITVEDTGGAEIDTAAMAHLSLSTPEERRLHAIAFHEWVTVRTASNKPPVTGSRMGIPDGPGLGIDVVPDLLGAPFFEIGR